MIHTLKYVFMIFIFLLTRLKKNYKQKPFKYYFNYILNFPLSLLVLSYFLQVLLAIKKVFIFTMGKGFLKKCHKL